MDKMKHIAQMHADLTRRYFLGLGAVGVAGAATVGAWGEGAGVPAALGKAVEAMEYLTREERFKNFGRGDPPPHQLPAEKLRAVGLHPDTWQLEVVADSETDAKVGNPLTRENGKALDWAGLMGLADKHAVRVMSVMSCTNGGAPCGMGLWEGVPLREVLWLAKPTGNIRRAFYYGYHNDDPKQRFQSSLPIGRVLEDPPGDAPILLCYKLNDAWLTPKRGGPVRMIVPDGYGNKSVKWLQRIVLTNNFQANDTYAGWNNDTESAIKTCARFVNAPKAGKGAVPLAITGLAQVGPAGLSKVQYWLRPRAEVLPDNDPYFAQGDWQDAEILPPPEHWGGGLSDGALPPVPRQIDPASGIPHAWPLRNTIAHWAALLENVAPGDYELACRTIDAHGVAQPMPRPFPKSGHNAIQQVPLTITA
jgi:DMSO/TMAO reductase YedYZ molybdopterin-dependent catalytic subunit